MSSPPMQRRGVLSNSPRNFLWKLYLQDRIQIQYFHAVKSCERRRLTLDLGSHDQVCASPCIEISLYGESDYSPCSSCHARREGSRGRRKRCKERTRISSDVATQLSNFKRNALSLASANRKR